MNQIVKKIIKWVLILIGVLILCLAAYIIYLKYGMPSTKIYSVEFEKKPANPDFQFVYLDTLNNKYLKELRETHNIAILVADASSDLDATLDLMDWTSRQWKHSGYNEPSNNDALTILREARKGNDFRCVEYGTVLISTLSSVGITARQLCLKTRDVAKVRTGAGHVATEVWLREFEKWAFADPQFNIIPVLNDVPLNAVEFRKAIEKKEKFELINKNGKLEDELKKQYMKFIPHYLYYFDVLFDQTIFIGNKDRYKYNGKSSLMLVPVGAENPTVFQRKSTIDYCFYTHSEGDFYQNPK